MRKITFILFTFFIFSVNAYAQPYGNEWIKFTFGNPFSDQEYFKLSIAKDGVYRLTYSDLLAAGFPVTEDPRKFQMFAFGKEQYIQVAGEADGTFDVTDFIQFLGYRNSGAIDSALYAQPSYQKNTKRSLINDTVSYFITVNQNSINNKRVIDEKDVNFSNYGNSPYFMRNLFNYNVPNGNYYYDSYHDTFGSALSAYMDGEGFAIDYLGAGAQNSSTTWAALSTPNATNVANTNINTFLGAETSYDHPYKVTVDGVDVVNSTFNGPFYKEDNVSVSHSNGTMNFIVTALANPQGAAEPNGFFVRYYDIDYPHTYSFNGEALNLYSMQIAPASNTAKSTLNITNLNLAQPILYTYNGDTVKNVSLSQTGNVWQAVVPTYYQPVKGMLVDASAIITNSGNVLKLTKVNYKGAPAGKFNNFANDGTKNYLIVTHAKFWNQATNYKNYRENNPVKNFNVLLADIHELYDQFAYGVEFHSLSIKGFAKFTLNNFAQKPEDIFIIGKGIMPQFSLDDHTGIYVPTFGSPPSDLMFTVGIQANDTVQRPAIAVGRFPAVEPYEVQDYLDKMITYEAAPKAEWMKKVMHFAGGSNANESQGIQQLMNGFANIIEDTLMGAYVRTLSKTANTPIQIDLSANLQNIIDSGLTLMTFFAHAASSSFDISTDVPSSWQNKDRYPLIIANSCYVGNMHKLGRYAAEDFVMQKQKGAIGFVGQASLGYVFNLWPYTTNLYKNFSWFNYGKSIGEQLLATIDSMQINYNDYGLDKFYAQAVALDMNLLGDPALHLNSPDKPDLVAATSDINILPKTLSTADDSLTIKITLRNIGRAVTTPFIVKISRTFANMNTVDTLLQLNKLAYTDTVTFRMAVDRAQGAGLNTFSFELDLNDQVQNECSEANNSAAIQLFIKSNDINALFPTKYAIIPDSNVTLVATTANVLAPPTVYVFQIDTNDTFNSPFMIEHKVTAPGGIINWALPFMADQDRVYYWRVSRDSIAGDLEHPYWDETSFVFKSGKSGWSQGHIYQFKDDGYNNIVWNRDNQNWNFIKTKSVIRANNNINNNGLEMNYYINGIVQAAASCFPQGVNAGINVAVIDDITLAPWNNREPGRNYGNWNNDNTKCNANRPDNFFAFPSSTLVPNYLDSLNDMLQNDIPVGKYLLMYSIDKNWYNAIPQNLKNTITALGSTNINFLNDKNCWIMFTRIGDPSATHEVIGDSLNPIVTLFDSLGGNWFQGYMVSEKIGPGVKWSSLHWETSQIEPLDSVTLDVVGYKQNGTSAVLIDDLAPTVNDIFNLDIYADTSYKYLELRSYMQDDSIVPDPVYMDKWQIFYQPLPEAMVDPSLYLNISKTKLNEADTVTVTTAIKNIGTQPMDSMLVSYYLYDAKNKKYDYPSKMYKPLNPGDTLHCSVTLPTAGLGGGNTLWIEANPNNNQPEQYHFNNYAQVSLNVDVDITNPILDVTFDGIHILNEDIVSARPRIQVSLKDENPVLVLDDTSDFYITLDEATVFQPKRIYFEPIEGTTTSSDLLTWTKGKLPDNKFKISISPVLENGLYKLVVQGKDKSNNSSAHQSYNITFEVENKPTITHVMNYPNPFSTSTRFVFTLTGSEIPEYFKIQVMTVTGKVIREINREELGPLHIGRNITSYAWDGTDEFGDRLANGVYLYRVITKLNGEDIEARETDADHFFVNGWGKMYLLR